MIEKTILSNLVLNNEYCRAVLPFIKEEYFVDSNNKIIFGIVKNFIKHAKLIPCSEDYYDNDYQFYKQLINYNYLDIKNIIINITNNEISF